MTKSETELIQGLKARDENITHDFFFRKCRPLFNAIIRDIFDNDADYCELINAFYEFLMEGNARRLDAFHGADNHETIYSWMKTTARHFFITRTIRESVIGDFTDNPLADDTCPSLQNSNITNKEAEMDIYVLLDQLRMKRDREVIIKTEIEEKSYDEISREMGISKMDLYRIHNRAMERLKKAARIAHDADDALCAIRCEQFVLDAFGIHRSIDELKKCASQNGWLMDSGARIEDIGKLPEQFGLTVKATPYSDIKAIQQSLDGGEQVMVAVDGGELTGDPVEEAIEDAIAGGVADHCVIVLTCNAEEDEICLYDPAYGDIPLTLSVGRFNDAWADSGYYMVAVSDQKSLG